MKNKPYILFLCFVFCRAAAQVSSPSVGVEAKTIAPASELPKRTELEKAADDTLDESVQRDAELWKKLGILAVKLQELTKNLDPKKAIKDSLTSSQLDEFNMLTAQQRYLLFSVYAEAIKRRKVLALMSLIETEEKDDELFAEQISSGNCANAAEVNAAISDGLRKLGLSEWETAMNQLAAIKDNDDARSIPLKLVVSILKDAKTGGCPVPDFAAFLMADDLKNTTAYRIFLARLDSEIKKGNKDAVDVAQYLVDEMNENESKKPSP
jgi:hypothetical protein